MERTSPSIKTADSQKMPKTNRLIMEKSPYLLQHAHNPVDWFPWGDEAFEKADRENKPIFLSIGYATCHWCHVMEHESFEDPEVAALLNENFVSIKVDREERPDVDHLYMTACQIMRGSGGWPLTIVMTPDKRPFFAATYLPRQSVHGRIGMLDLLPQLVKAWHGDRDQLNGLAERLTGAIKEVMNASSSSEPVEDSLHLAFRHLARQFDPKHGGFGRQMKFPMPHQLLFLLRYWYRTGNGDALKMVEQTLTAMRHGGIFDQLGFGFHRYTTEPSWLVPHFEKMLYDQALLMLAYTEAYQATGNPLFERTVREIATYIRREMTANTGGFFSAEDADSEGKEGKFYLWTEAEIRQLLDEETAQLVIESYGISPGGNFSEHPGETDTGQNIPHLAVSTEHLAARHQTDVKTLERQLDTGRRVLFATRQNRVHPLKDDKVLTDWNGLMIGALARAARVLGDPTYAHLAERSARFVLKTLVDDDGRLLHRYRDNKAGIQATLDDYAFFVFGLIELYESTFEILYLEQAVRLAEVMLAHFDDPTHGGFFLTAADAPVPITRPKEIYDGAIPSGSSVAIYNLLRLARLTGNSAHEERAARAMKTYGDALANSPTSHAMFLLALDFAVGPSLEIVVAGETRAQDTNEMLKTLATRYLPNHVLLLRDEAKAAQLARLAPYTADQRRLKDAATAYICVDHACSFPTNDVTQMMTLIDERLAAARPADPPAETN